MRSSPVLAAADGALRAGGGTVDVTPPLGIELAGFHRAPGNERRATGVRQPSAARALALQVGSARTAIVAIDMCTASSAFSRQVRDRVAADVGIPASHVRVCATHSHSMPTFVPLLQWGGVNEDYATKCADACVEAVRLAVDDLAAAELYHGKSRAQGGNSNRTSKDWRTEEAFASDSTDANRWLDTAVQLMRFERSGKPDLLWYHFSSHPVCYADGESGPDWVGLVAQRVNEKHGVAPGFLQGHCGDVNPGDGSQWIGDADATADAVADAVDRALAASIRIPVTEMRMQSSSFEAPLDLNRFKEEIDRYRTNPADCAAGEYVDSGFAKSWFDLAEQWDFTRGSHASPIAAMRLGEVSLAFHPAELYSYYGLRIQQDSPTPHTISVGYTDDFIGYLTDPRAYEAGEYEALVVPKILSLPPFTTDAARQMAARVNALLHSIA